MKILIDNVSNALEDKLKERGHDVERVADKYHLWSDKSFAPDPGDEVILLHAKEEGKIVVTNEKKEFQRYIALHGYESPGLVQLRGKDKLDRDKYHDKIVQSIEDCEIDLKRGAVVALSVDSNDNLKSRSRIFSHKEPKDLAIKNQADGEKDQRAEADVLKELIDQSKDDISRRKSTFKEVSQEQGRDSLGAMKAQRAVEEAEAAYESGKQEWHRRAVRSDAYKPFDAELGKKVSDIKKDEADAWRQHDRRKLSGEKEKTERANLQRQLDQQLQRSFSTQKDYGFER